MRDIQEMRIAYKILNGKSEDTSPVVRSRHRGEENIRMDLRDVGWKGLNWIYLS
jgi:hypothetical protein